MTWAAVATIGGAAIGAGGSIISAHNSGGGAGEPPWLAQGSPAGNAIGSLFGSRFSNRSGWVPDRRNPNAIFSPGRIGPLVEDYIGNPLIGSSAISGLRGILDGGLIPNVFSRSMQGLSGLSDLALLGSATGFNTSAQPAFQEAIRRFGADILPQIAETSGLGLQSSGFLNLAGRESSNLLGQAALRQTELDEAAADRRVGLLPIAGQLQAAEAAFPLNFTADLEARRAVPFNTFLQLSQAGNNLPLIQQGFPTADSTSDMLAGLGSLAGSIGPLLKIFQGGA